MPRDAASTASMHSSVPLSLYVPTPASWWSESKPGHAALAQALIPRDLPDTPSNGEDIVQDSEGIRHTFLWWKQGEKVQGRELGTGMLISSDWWWNCHQHLEKKPEVIQAETEASEKITNTIMMAMAALRCHGWNAVAHWFLNYVPGVPQLENQ